MLDSKTATEVALLVNYAIGKQKVPCKPVTREEAMLMNPISISPVGGDIVFALQKGHWTILVDFVDGGPKKAELIRIK